MPVTTDHDERVIDLPDLYAAADAAALAIPPAWPLASSVAVNPFLGQAGLDLPHTAALLSRVGGCPVTMPRMWFHERLAAGVITREDIQGALDAAPAVGEPITPEELRLPARLAKLVPDPCPTIADFAADVSGIDWPGIVDERFGAWAAGFLDQGQALWAGAERKGAFASWRSTAVHDLTPEIAGLTGFAASVGDGPNDATDALAEIAVRLHLRPDAARTYFHRLLASLGGWAQCARYLLWQARLDGRGDDTITDFLTIRLVWEDALLTRYRDCIGDAWQEAMARFAHPIEPTRCQRIDAVLQEASERAAQRTLGTKLRAGASAASEPTADPVAVQAAFCIDVRSEVFRRALEGVSPRVRTLGFAGFFGLPVEHMPFASDVAERRLPVLLNPGLHSRSDGAGGPADAAARFRARASRAWGRFKLAAVSSFAFVEATGPIYVAKLIRDAVGRGGRRGGEPRPVLDPQPDLPTRVATAAAVLRAMSLTTDFAPLVLLVGHGASVVNNPHESALHCGACGGHRGDVNARLLASLLNDPGVRAGLMATGIVVPPSTSFVGALHDTTTDDVTVFTDDSNRPPDGDLLRQTSAWLKAAGERARAERAPRLPRANGGRDIPARSRDWSETRPEWGLAGCNAFIAAPRARTAGSDLGGRAFLHDYDWRADEGFKVLELILTAPVVVASWISLQYYGSTVAPGLFGAGNKLLHNVVGGIGVLEGNGGSLRAGLPLQSVHDGQALAHEPLRLTVCIDAPAEAIADVLSRHPDVRALFDNRWLHLFAMGDTPGLGARYLGDLRWEAGGSRSPSPMRPA